MQTGSDDRTLSYSQRFVGRGVLLAAFLILASALGDGLSEQQAVAFDVPAGVIAAT